MSTPSFNWITFLLGFAIALWIALVLLFVIPDDDPPTLATACHAAGCSSCCGGKTIAFRNRTLWISAGDDREYCTNNDNGGGYIEDNGGGYVDDNGGGYIDDNGGGYIDDNGGGYVDDGWPRVPAPTSEELARARDTEEFQCRSNDNGGGYIEDTTRRSVALPIPNDNRFACWRDPGHNASVVRTEESGGVTVYRRVRFDKYQNVVLLDEVSVGDVNDLVFPGNNGLTDDFLFCMVPLTTEAGNAGVVSVTNHARILQKTGQCVVPAAVCNP